MKKICHLLIFTLLACCLFFPVKTKIKADDVNLPLIFDIATGKFYLDSAAGKYNELELPGESAYPDEEYTEQADNWSWDPDTKTLTLSDFHYKVSGALSGYGANKLEPGDPMGFRGIRAPAAD